MINKIFGFLIFVLLSLSVTPALTQSDQTNGYSVQHFTDENGLPQNSVNDLLFDKNGYIWLASQAGLVCFNGSSFQSYYPDDKPVMKSGVLYLGKNEKGNLYFQTRDHNLYCYPGNNRRLISPVTTPSSVLQKPYLLNTRKQLFDFSSFLEQARSELETTRRKKIFQFLFGHNESFYVADAKHFYFINKDSLYYYDSQQVITLTSLAGHPLQYLLLDKKLYLLTRNSVAAAYSEGRLEQGASIIEGISKGKDPFQLYSSGKMTHLLTGSLLYRLKPGAKKGLKAEFLLDLKFISNVSSVEYDSRLDLLLIATRTEGFYLLRKNRFRDDWSGPLRQKMAQHLFGPLALSRQGEILTDKFIFTPGGKYIPVRDTAPVWQRCLYVDRKNQVWGAFNDLPRRLNAALDAAAVLPALDATIVDYAEDTAGQLYCLTEKSLWRMETDGFHRIFTTARPSGKEVNECFSPAGEKRLWIGSTSGVLEYDLEKKTARYLAELKDAHVRAIHVCRDGDILLGTYGQGYFYYHHQRMFRMPLDKKGFLITAHCFLEDGHGYVWIPCNKGLFKVPKNDMDAWCEGSSSELYYYYYGRQDGLLTNEFNGGFNSSGVITPAGFVALLSMKGMVCFNVDSLDTNIPDGAIDMTHLEADGRSMAGTDTIHLAANYNNLSVEMSCPYLGSRDNLYLQYNLKGLNDEWKEIPEDGIINLSRLAPGRYTLEVRKVNGFGKNNYQYRHWTLIVPALFYRTTWFMLLLATVLFVLLFLLVQLRLKLLEKKQEIRVKAEKLKGAVVRLEETVAKLQQSEQELLKTNRQREKLISLVIHDLRSPLRFLTMLASDLHDNQGNLLPDEMKDRTYWVKKGAQDIYNFSEDFLLWVTSQTDNFKITKRQILLKPLLQEINDFFLEQVLQKGNSISYAADEELKIYSDPHVLITIIRNLTDNANKYTNQGTIRITAYPDGSDMLISVTDTGKGMSPQQIAGFLGKDSLDNLKSGSQLGHKFIYDLTQRLNGTLTVESAEEQGTTVWLRFPSGGEDVAPET